MGQRVVAAGQGCAADVACCDLKLMAENFGNRFKYTNRLGRDLWANAVPRENCKFDDHLCLQMHELLAIGTVIRTHQLWARKVPDGEFFATRPRDSLPGRNG